MELYLAQLLSFLFSLRFSGVVNLQRVLVHSRVLEGEVGVQDEDVLARSSFGEEVVFNRTSCHPNDVFHRPILSFQRRASLALAKLSPLFFELLVASQLLLELCVRVKLLGFHRFFQVALAGWLRHRGNFRHFLQGLLAGWLRLRGNFRPEIARVSNALLVVQRRQPQRAGIDP